MRKKPKKIFVKRLVTMFILINWFSGSMSWLPTSLLYAEGEQEISSPTQEEVQPEEYEASVDENRANGTNTTSNQTTDTQPSVDQPTVESTPAPLDLSELTNLMNQLEQTLQEAIANRVDEAVIAETQQIVTSAKDLLQSKQLTQEKLEEVLLQLQTQNETLIFLNKKADVQVGTRNVDSSNQKDGDVLFGATNRDIGYARKDMIVNKVINYEKHSINWTIYFNRSGETWNYPYYYVVLPDHNGEVKVNRSIPSEPLAANEYGSGQLSNEFSNRILKHIPTGNVKTDLEKWRDEYLSNMIVFRERTVDAGYQWTFTTTHSPDTNLDKLPIIVGGHGASSGPDTWPRGRAVGPFGAALRHDLQKPTETIWVKDKNQLTEDEKEKVRKAVVVATIAHYKNQGLSTEEQELNARRNSIEVSNTGAVSIRWEDGTQSVRNDVYLKVKQKELNVELPTQEVMEQAPIQEIKITGIGPDAMIDSIEAVNLPTGLNISQNTDKTYSITGTISNVAFPEGQETVDYSFKVKATDPTDGQVIEEPITITVKKNPGLVPVGTHERGYHLPFLLLSLGSLATLIMWTKLRMKEDQTEW